MSGASRRPAAPLLTALRLLLRYGLPLLGLLLIGRAVVVSIGGEIEKGQFALGVLLMALSVSARLVPKSLPKSSLKSAPERAP
ncbi:hypothetical protein [uncultured Methylobacterium sp.]|uniref:hypothetical protein n=1 Tax=uncultured Methylobacterium sp. TaxID=157278 RepID=UPI0035CC7FE9